METTADLPPRVQAYTRTCVEARPSMSDRCLRTKNYSQTVEAVASGTRSLTTFQKLAKSRIEKWLNGISWGRVELIEDTAERAVGYGQTSALEPNCQLIVRQPEFYWSVAKGGAMGLAESYLRHEWDSKDLTTLLRVLYRQHELQEKFRSAVANGLAGLRRLLESLWGNTIARSRKQIAAHYDLSNEFFELFLDPTLMYSSAFFEHPKMTLHEASLVKLDKICERLQLRSGEHVLEIGTGWGGFGLHLTENHDVRLTTTTISRQQYAKAAQRFASSANGDRIELLEQDYRKLSGVYDKLVSIEMIEAVGERNLETFFRKCGNLLRPGGRLVIQAIVMPEQRYEGYRRGFDFIQKYIFPGGFLPSISALQQSAGRTTDFRLSSIDDLTPHYARTLREWRSRFLDRLEEVRELGFDDRFIRMWEYYLCYCEAAFLEQAVRVVQIAWDRPQR